MFSTLTSKFFLVSTFLEVHFKKLFLSTKKSAKVRPNTAIKLSETLKIIPPFFFNKKGKLWENVPKGIKSFMKLK